jgi:tetrahydromethanopterin S-methyltransferase subunit C
MLMTLETVLALAAVGVSFAAAGTRSELFDRAEFVFRSIARRRRLAVLLVAGSALVARVMVLPVLPVPVPRVDDEHSHLLLADTLLHGRLANPTHPMWIHFEALEVNMRPNYASVYPPMQGIFLAAGHLLSGSPFFGVMLSVAVMCGAICWMLQGWMRAEWALLGGLLATIRYGVFTYWADSYMGGAPAAIGGALMLGALLRIKQDPRPRNGAVLGLGIAILANSRPYEGFLLSAVAAVALFYLLFISGHEGRRKVFKDALLPAGVIVLLTGLGMMYYFWRVSGSPFRTPYQIAWETYGMTPKFPWQSLRPQQESALRHEALNHFYYVFEMKAFLAMQSFTGLITEWGIRAFLNWEFYLGPLLSLPLVVAVAIVPYGFGWKQLGANTKFLLACAAAVVAGISVEVFCFPHYAAPITCVVIALVVMAMRRVRKQKFCGRPVGLWLSRLIPLLLLVMLALRAAAVPLQISLPPSLMPSIYYSVYEKAPGNLAAEYLQKIPGQHLVIVHYVPGTEDWMGWVHNEADIDRSRIVWAWDMGSAKNRELVDYFCGRRVWFINVTEKPSIPKPYQLTELGGFSPQI